MTEVRMIGQVSGTRNGEDWPAPGDTIDLPEDEARSLIVSGMAARVDRLPVVGEFGEIQTRTDSSTGIPVGGMVWNNELHATEADLVRRPDANSDTVVAVGTASETVINERADTREAVENATSAAATPNSAKSSKTMTTDTFNPTTDTTAPAGDTTTTDAAKRARGK